MQISRFLPLAFVVATVATPVISKRDAQTVVADLNTVNERTLTLNDTITAFQGGNDIVGALRIQAAANDVMTALNQTTTDADASDPFSDNDAISIAVAVNTLSPTVISTLDNLESKRADFGSGVIPLYPVVALTLQNQRQSTVDSINAITNKIPDALKPAAAQIVQPILDKFDEAIAVYGGGLSIPSGLPTSLPIPLPTSLPTGLPISLPSLPTGVPGITGLPGLTSVLSGLPTGLPGLPPVARKV